MAAPIVGPLITTQDIPGLGNGAMWLYENRWQYSQARPFDLMLPYTRVFGTGSLTIRSNTGYPTRVGNTIFVQYYTDSVHTNAYPTEFVRGIDGAYARCFSKLISDLDAKTANLGVSIMEGKESIQTITKRLESLWKIMKGLRKLDLQMIYDGLAGSDWWQSSMLRSEGSRNRRTFRVNTFDGHMDSRTKVYKKVREVFTARKLGKDFSQCWLELMFGWGPILQDIHDVLEFIDSFEFPKEFIHGKATYHGVGLPQRDWPYGGWVNLRHSWRMCLQVRVTNPMLYMANQLGLANPLQILWESSPLLWLSDWFLHLNQYFRSFSALWGLTVVQGTTSFLRSFYGEAHYNGTDVDDLVHVGSYFYNRSLGTPALPGAWSYVRLPRKDLLGRGVTLTSLLNRNLTPLRNVR